MNCTNVRISTDELNLEFDCQSGFKAIEMRRQTASSWVSLPDGGKEFAVYYDGKQLTGLTDDLVVVDSTSREVSTGVRHYTTRMVYSPDEMAIEAHTLVYEKHAMIEKWVTVTNHGSQAVRIERVDSFSVTIPENDYELMYFKSGWAEEFESVRETLDKNVAIDCRKGRSSYDYHPWFTLFRKSDGELLTGAIAWSGNWIVRFEDLGGAGFDVSGGLHDWEFFKDLEPGSSMDSPHVILALGGNNDLNETSRQFIQAGRDYWYPRNEVSESLPVEWNHWWPYEDKTIDESTFHDNVVLASQIGVELCTLDAGWFGPSESGTFWYDYRGDWHLVNSARFPNGLQAVARDVHKHGMKFGLWCEIEALGRYANLGEVQPDFAAQRDDKPIGYVCFGNKNVQEWAFQTLHRLITETEADWIKLDFNIDPGAGCSRTDHGHGAGDGLYEHVLGYYQTLERVRDCHPNVVLENCSGGGLRIDLGILRQTHTTFVSDADWPEHNLQVFWGVSTMLAPDVSLHWSFNEWCGNNKHPRQTFHPQNKDLKQHQIDYYIRTGMLGGFGFSQKLPELPDWILARYQHHAEVYKTYVKRFVRSADFYRLTPSPRRELRGDRWAAFQYSMAKEQEHLVFVFRLDGGESTRSISLRDLDGTRRYTVRWLSNDLSMVMTGWELTTTGLFFDNLLEEDSALLLISPLD